MNNQISHRTALTALHMWRESILDPSSLPAIDYRPDGRGTADHAVDDPRGAAWTVLAVGVALSQSPHYYRVAVRLMFKQGVMPQSTAYRHRRDLLDYIALHLRRDLRHEEMSIADAAIREMRQRRRKEKK